MIRRSESVKALVTKLLAIQKAVRPAKKSKDNPFFNSKYADLKEVYGTIFQAMEESATDVLIEQYAVTDYGKMADKMVVIKRRDGTVLDKYQTKVPTVRVTTRITEPESGEWQEIDFEMTPADDTPQAIGSTETYARRYSLMPPFNIAPSEDDGNYGTGNVDDKRTDKEIAEAATKKTKTKPAEQPEPEKPRMIGARTDEIQAKSGYISFAQYDCLVAACKAESIDKAPFLAYLKNIHGANSPLDIKRDIYDYILAIIQRDAASVKENRLSSVVDWKDFRGDDAAR